MVGEHKHVRVFVWELWDFEMEGTLLVAIEELPQEEFEAYDSPS